jgi:uncharacterized protein YdeI (BOF family)
MDIQKLEALLEFNLATNMSTARLTFLYPHLFRSIKAAEPGVQTARQCRQHPRANFTTTPQKSQFVQRHGKAVEHAPLPEDNKSEVNSSPPEIGSLKFKRQEAAEHAKEGKQNKDETKPPPPDLSSSAPLSEETQAAHISSDVGVYSTMGSSGSSPPQGDNVTHPNSQNAGAKSFEGELPIDTILHMDPPSATSPSGEPLPHLVPPPYVHNFDSYTLVKQVESGGFTSPQAVTAMKVVRALLAENLDVAKEGLVSKSDVENETYLFQAACSELRTEIQNARRVQDEKMRAQRTLLQHEVEILNQKLTQELLALKDELRGMFNDRKMEVRMDQRSMESAVRFLFLSFSSPIRQKLTTIDPTTQL